MFICVAHATPSSVENNKQQRCEHSLAIVKDINHGVSIHGSEKRKEKNG